MPVGAGHCVVARYYRELLNFLSRMLGDRDAAADLAQESYARVLAVQQSGEPIAEPRALLYRTARNLAIDHHRRSEVRAQAHPSDTDEPLLPMEMAEAPLACQPDVAAASAQAVNALLAAIGALPLRCREAFILHKFDGLSQAEVAAHMGISVKMVERHIKLGMQACRACHEQMESPSPVAHPQRDKA